MAEIDKKIEQLKKKISTREARIEKSNKKISEEKFVIKTSKNEIEEFRFEIKQLELEKLSETLSKNGITAADVTAAIAAGEIKRSQPDKTLDDSADTEDREKQTEINNINSDNKEVTENETYLCEASHKLTYAERN